MCGIAGFTQFHRKLGDENTLVEMGNTIAHRGPDAHGEYIDEHIGLCHRRLSIIDLSAAGTQPMYSADNNLVLVFNGEIYNFLELRKALSDKGYTFKTQTDTEVILALYQAEGEACIKKLNGMFAIALWDKRKKTLLLARDRVGKKPLYYYHDNNAFAFASEIKALLAVPSIPRDIRDDAIYDFFAYQYIPDPKTIFNNIYKLEPSHLMLVDENGCQTKRYWNISFSQTGSESEDQTKENLHNLIQSCTAQRMISDVPLGAFLSGGVDSSGIVALMAQQSDKPVTTCSIGFDEEKFNETEFAASVAKQYATHHNEFTVHDNVEDNLEKIASYFDEPFADPSLVPTYFVSQLARKAVTVALAGDGGDEIFAGYEKYTNDFLENRWRNRIPAIIRKKLFPALSVLLSKMPIHTLRRAGSLLHSLSLDAAMGFYVSNSQISDRLWARMTNDRLKTSLGPYHPSHITTQAYDEADTDNHLHKILYTDMKTYLPGDILVKVDRMSMAHSLEVRAPLLDYRVMEYAATIPSQLKFNRGEKKYILKECFKPLLPDDILYRKKMGFSVPLASWLRHELKALAEKQFFANKHPVNAIDCYFNREEIQAIWHEHQSEKFDHSAPLWSLLMFTLWFDRYANHG